MLFDDGPNKLAAYKRTLQGKRIGYRLTVKFHNGRNGRKGFLIKTGCEGRVTHVFVDDSSQRCMLLVEREDNHCTIDRVFASEAHLLDLNEGACRAATKLHPYSFGDFDSWIQKDSENMLGSGVLARMFSQASSSAASNLYRQYCIKTDLDPAAALIKLTSKMARVEWAKRRMTKWHMLADSNLKWLADRKATLAAAENILDAAEQACRNLKDVIERGLAELEPLNVMLCFAEALWLHDQIGFMAKQIRARTRGKKGANARNAAADSQKVESEGLIRALHNDGKTRREIMSHLQAHFKQSRSKRTLERDLERAGISGSRKSETD